eukprot:9735885-Ditylum_brightwellii.AAC.1
MEGPDCFNRCLCSRAVMAILDNNNTADGVLFYVEDEDVLPIQCGGSGGGGDGGSVVVAGESTAV